MLYWPTQLLCTISGISPICIEAPNARVIFKGQGGTLPYKFVYQVNGGTEITTTATAVGKDTISVKVPTDKTGSISYKLIKVVDGANTEQPVTSEIKIDINPLPNSSFSFDLDNTCSGTPIKFTPDIPGNYTYNWDFKDGTTSNDVSPTHAFNAVGTGVATYDVILTISDNLTKCQSSSKETIKVKKGPDASLNLDPNTGTPYDPTKKIFINCGATQTSPQFNFLAVNGSTTTNTGYVIDWGDGTTPEKLPANFTSINHQYNKLGYFDIRLTAQNDNSECKSGVTIYKFFNGNSPGGNLGSAGNTTDCAPYTLTWPVTFTENNPPGTTYEFRVDDGSPPQKYVQSNLPNTISHTFTKSSCNNLPDKKFNVVFIAKNPCDSSKTTLQVKASEKPKANFEFGPKVCLNSAVTFTNKSTGYDDNCSTIFTPYWSITPSTGWTGTLNNSNTINITFNTIGEYSVKLKIKKPGLAPDSRCTADSITKIIKINPLPTGTISGGATVCKDATSPDITFTGTSGTAPFTFTYKINNGSNQTIKTISGNSVILKAPTNNSGKFTYTLVSVQDANGCSQAQNGTAIIEIKPAPTATIAGPSNTCQNASPPLITFTGSGGTQPYTFKYNIDNGNNKTVSTTSGNTVTVEVPTENLGTFKYNLVGVTDASANACTSSQTGSVTITVNQSPGTLTLIDYEFCNGVTTSPIVFTNTVTGTTYSWTNNDTSIGLPANGTGNIPSFVAKNSTSNPISSSITVTPKANGCTGNSETFTIKVNPSASVIFTPGNQTVCSGENTQSVQLSSSTAGATFNWTAIQQSGITGMITSGTDIIPVQTLTNSTNAPIDVIYKAKATVAGATSCAGTEYSYTITVNPIPEIKEVFSLSSCSNIPFNVIPTNGGANSVPAGTTYTWAIPIISPAGTITGASEQTMPQTSISQTLTNSASSTVNATYIVTPIFKGCTGNTFEVKVNVEPVPSVDKVNNVILCNTEQSPLITFTGSPAGTVFKWTCDNPGIGMSASGTNFIAPFAAINAGPLPEKAMVTVTPVFNDCNGTQMQFSITLNPTGQVNNPGTQNLCNGQNATVNFTTINTGGSTTYSWTNNNPAIGLSSLGNGNITFTPVNNGNTVLNATIAVTPEYSANGVICKGTTDQFTVTVNPTTTVNHPDNQTLCNGVLTNEVKFTGNIPGTIFTWSNDNPSVGLPTTGQGDITSFVAKNNTLNPVTAKITVTPSINGCNGESKYFTITVNPAGIITKQPVPSDICLSLIPNQLSVEFTNGTGPPTYQWYSNNVDTYTGGTMVAGAIQSTFDPPYLKADTTFYYCIISFPSGTCKILISDIAKVAINALPVISALNTEINSGETFTVIPNSLNGNVVPTGTTYTWSEPTIKPAGSVTGAFSQTVPQSSISQTLTGSATETATVTYNVTPISGLCIGAEFQVIVKVQPPIYTSTKVIPITCYGANDAIIEVFVSGGVAPYQIEWSNMGTGHNQSNLSPGVYTIKITDAVGVQKSISETIEEANQFSISPVVKQITCFGSADGSITLNFQGGEPPITLNWSDNSTAGSTRNNLGPGNYSVTIIDNKGCRIDETFIIIEPLPILISAIVTNSLGCSEQNKGAIDLTVSGGIPLYSYSWSNGSTTEDLVNIPAGNYTIKVTDIIGCSNTAPYVVTRPGAIEIATATSIKYDCTSKTVTEVCTAIVKGGVPPHHIEWSTGITSGVNNEIMETDQSGLVELKVTDALGCISNFSFTTDIPVLGIEHQMIDCDLHSYSFNVVNGDESQKLTYLWDFGDGTTSDIRNPFHNFKQEGTYPVSLVTTNTITACISQYELPLQVDPRPTVTLDKNPKLCEGDTLTLYANGADNYKWSTGLTNDFESFRYEGNIFVIGYADSGCTDTAYFDVSFYKPRGYEIFTDRLEITNEQRTVHFWSDIIPFSDYEWDFDDGTIVNGLDQYHSFDQLRDGYFDVMLQVINPDGCPEKDTEKILVTIESIPNTFTPNNDGFNDIFMNGWDKKIYNRNGILMYEGKEGWDGTYNGKPVSSDTYFVIVYDSSETGSRYRTGYVTVIR